MNTARFLAPAEEEMLEAAAYYESRAAGLGRDFLRKVCNAISDIENHPDRWPVLELGVRRRLVHRFPYAVLYKHEGGETVIVAVMHLRRQPNYWIARL
jgi:plasmid stabilization system protein ParE